MINTLLVNAIILWNSNHDDIASGVIPFYVYKKQRDSYRFMLEFCCRICDNWTDYDLLAMYFWKIYTGKKIRLDPKVNIVIVNLQEYLMLLIALLCYLINAIF